MYFKQSVYDEHTNYNYFTFTPFKYVDSIQASGATGYTDSQYDIENGVEINIKEGATLIGKVTLPSYDPSGRPVVSVGSTFARAHQYSYNGKAKAQ